MTRLVYLSGPISRTDYAGATSWYVEARRLINARIALLRPMRSADFLRSHRGIIGACDASSNGWDLDEEGSRLASMFCSRQAMVSQDRFDARRADAVLMNLTGANGRVSIGCAMEAAWADAARKPIVMVAEPGNVHEGHPLLEAVASFRCSTLADGCLCINELFKDDHPR